MKMLLMLLLLASGWISAQNPPSRPDRSPDAVLRAAYFLPKAVMKAVNDPVFASLFGTEKKESYFHTALVGMDGAVFWIHHPKAEAPIPVDATKPERWFSAFRNDLELFGIAAATNPGTQAGRKLWNALDEYGITGFFIDSSPSASGYLTSIEVALALEFKVLRSVETMNTPQCFLRTYFRIYQFSLADAAIRESYTFVCRKDQDKILAVLAQRPLGTRTPAEAKVIDDQIKKAYGLDPSISWSTRHVNMFGSEGSEGGIWMPDAFEGESQSGQGMLRKFWLSRDLPDYRQEIARGVERRWFEARKKLYRVNSDEEAIAAEMQDIRAKMGKAPAEAQGQVKALYGMAKGSQLEAVRQLDDDIDTAWTIQQNEAARKADLAKSIAAAEEKAKWSLINDLRNSYNFLSVYEKSLAYEKKVAAESGVKNLSRQYELGRYIVGLKEMIARQHAEFRKVFGHEFDLAKDTVEALQKAEAKRKTSQPGQTTSPQ